MLYRTCVAVAVAVAAPLLLLLRVWSNKWDNVTEANPCDSKSRLCRILGSETPRPSHLTSQSEEERNSNCDGTASRHLAPASPRMHVIWSHLLRFGLRPNTEVSHGRPTDAADRSNKRSLHAGTRHTRADLPPTRGPPAPRSAEEARAPIQRTITTVDDTGGFLTWGAPLTPHANAGLVLASACAPRTTRR